MIAEYQQELPLQRLRLTFGKEGAARYISHLDLARAIERALNRARLPVAYTLGFNRRLRLSLAAALPLGYTSDAELADIFLIEVMNPDMFRQLLAPQMPPGIPIHHVTEVSLQSPSIQQQIVESIYGVRFLDPVDIEALRGRIEELLTVTTLPFERPRQQHRKTKMFDLRPHILELRMENQAEGELRLQMRLTHTPKQTGRPDDVLTALGFDPHDVHIHRRAIVLTPIE